jgi:hypothetical protein
MPIHTINNVALHYEERGDRSKPSLVLAGPLLFGAQGFDLSFLCLKTTFISSASTFMGTDEAGFACR